MSPFLRFLLILAPVVAPVFAQNDRGDLGTLDVYSNVRTVPVRVSADTPELNSLALTAFESHGRYRLVASGYAYDIRFSTAGPSQVRVEIAKTDGQPVAAELVSGTSLHNALLRAADVAVEKTNGLGLRGFFASQLAFIGEATGHKEVYVGDLFFTNGSVHRITNNRVISMTPRWSPDGRKVIYTSWLHGAPDIYLMDLAANQWSTFASYRGSNFSARFSPNGRQVAMVSTDQRSGASEIYVTDALGRGPSPRTHSDSVKASPCWSPDGSRLVFAQEPGPQLYVMSSGGGFPRRITSGGISRYCAEPDWSRANPNKIVFTVMIGSRFQIAVYDFAKGESEVVSKAPFDGVEPCWLPDGRHVVYTARDSRSSAICILDTESGKSTRISPRGFGPTLQANVLAP